MNALIISLVSEDYPASQGPNGRAITRPERPSAMTKKRCTAVVAESLDTPLLRGHNAQEPSRSWFSVLTTPSLPLPSCLSDCIALLRTPTKMWVFSI